MDTEKVLNFFREITRIPRESGHEEKIVAYLQQFAASRGLECKTDEVFLSKTRKREIVQARQIAMYLSRSLTKTSLSSIGSQLGGKDHATVLHACNTVSDLMDTDRSFRGFVHDIERVLNSPE